MLLSSKTNNSTFNQIRFRYTFPIKFRYIFIIYLLLNLIGLMVYAVAVSLVPSFPNFEDPILTHVIYIYSFGGLCYYLWEKLRLDGLKPQYLIGNKISRYHWWSLLGLVIVLLLFSLGAGLLLHGVLLSFAPNFLEFFLEEESQVSSLPIIYKCLETINIIVVAPITEEFIFRGVLLHRFATKWNIAIAIWISSIIFGLLHPLDPVGASLFGVVMALLYLKTKTLTVPIVAHAMNNTIAVIVQVWGTFVENNGSIAESTTEISSGDWIIGLLLVAVSLPFLIRFIYRRFPAKNKLLPYFANEAKAIAEISD